MFLVDEYLRPQDPHVTALGLHMDDIRLHMDEKGGERQASERAEGEGCCWGREEEEEEDGRAQRRRKAFLLTTT